MAAAENFARDDRIGFGDVPSERVNWTHAEVGEIGF